MEKGTVDKLPGFKRRMDWFTTNRPDLCGNLASLSRQGIEQRRLLSVVARPRLVRLMEKCSPKRSSSRRTGFALYRNSMKRIRIHCT